MKHVLILISVLCIRFFIPSIYAQVTPYHLNGNAYKEDCNCYTLTTEQNFQSGSVWNINKIDLNQSFDFKFNVFLGCKDADGADGIVFVLQAISTSIGTAGGGIGYDGVNPSIGITIDTWQNFNNSDPPDDHIAIHRNGDINHSGPNNLAGPVSAITSSNNIEDCKWHILRIVWDAPTKTLRADMDGAERVKTTIDLVGSVFNGDPKVFWGFTSATGGSNNHQRVCTSLNPGFTLPPGQTTCFPDPVQFIDSSASFGSIVKWYWNFGDGTVDSVNQTPPLHVYSAPGNYQVSLNILGNNGCLSDTFKQTIVMGSKPMPAFNYTPAIACQNSPIDFKDLSTVQFGTINVWLWDIDGQWSSLQNPSLPSTAPGQIRAQLVVETKEGCTSDIISQSVSIKPNPTVDFDVDDICADTAAFLSGKNLDPSINIQQWNWNFGDNRTANSRAVQHFYTDSGKYNIQLMALADNGCNSSPVSKTLTVHKTNAYAGKDTLAAQGEPFSLNGSGGILYSWSPAAGLSDPMIPNPSAILQKDATFILTAYTPAGCASSDTVNIQVYKGPTFYVPNAFTPNGDGKNDRLRCIAIGISKTDFFNVYNRYGQLIFSSTSYQPGWDGTVGGIKQASGTYVWMVKGKDATGKIHFKKGTVTLIR